jgi:hypothetical protein
MNCEFEIPMTHKITLNSVEATKASSSACKQLFPEHLKPPFQGELQNIIRFTQEAGGSLDQAQKAGNWWLWVRELFIENTMPKPAKIKMMRHAASSAVSKTPIHIVTTRSPELLHAQIGMASPDLPRSQKTLLRVKELIAASSVFLPTTASVFLADLAIDNLDLIAQKCDIASTVQQNLQAITLISQSIGLTVNIDLLSHLVCQFGPLADLISPSGQPIHDLPIPMHAWPHIKIVNKETIESHQRQFGWTTEQSEKHNLNLAITMGCVGNALAHIPNAILLHNEAFISRGALNNIFNSPQDPLPVICLKDVLDRKQKPIQ